MCNICAQGEKRAHGTHIHVESVGGGLSGLVGWAHVNVLWSLNMHMCMHKEVIYALSPFVPVHNIS